ncbi:MAG: glycosyltransferase family A protein [Bacteroidota bacterium]
MGLSIITPHYNDFSGITKIYDYLMSQSSENWQWIIVDDCSSVDVKNNFTVFFENNTSSKIKIVFNESKTNASSCRNLGVEYAIHDNLVFLDSDDKITSEFVKNRLITIEDFAVFLNFNLFNSAGEVKPFSTVKNNFLDHFLKANFVWQTTAVLWNTSFFKNLGKFNTSLSLLEDIEISIRALLSGNNFEILNNSDVDFYYYAKPIDIKQRTVEKVTASVNQLITNLTTDFELNKIQLKKLKAYYFLSVRYLVRSGNKDDISYVQSNLKLFLNKKCISFLQFVLGTTLLWAYSKEMISDTIFLKINRYFFKSK